MVFNGGSSLRQRDARDALPPQTIRLGKDSRASPRRPSRQFLPNFAFAAVTHTILESPARASHFSMATL